MDAAAAWKSFLGEWPSDLPRRGVLVTRQNEQIIFDGFLTSASLALFDRKTPDPLGARKVLLAYEDVAAIKFIDIVKTAQLTPSGFAGKLKDI